MADNSTQNGTDTIATDDLATLNGGAVSGVKVQRVKVGFGSDASFRDVDASNGMPVYQMASLPAGTNAIGTVTAVGDIANAATDSGNPVKIGGIYRANASVANLTDGQRGNLLLTASGAAKVQLVGTSVSLADGIGFFGISASQQDGPSGTPTALQGVIAPLYNGSTYDRPRGMGFNTTTGDIGAKTATGNGATQTNVGNKGVQVVINMGVVSGTTPTFVGKLQGSADGGTTWYDIPGATTASLVATGVWGITVYPGIAVTAGTTTTGSTATTNMPLPRTWRLVWTIGGTTPSFTITNVQYNYLVN